MPTRRVPEEIILAVLNDFGRKKPAEVLREILRKLQDLSGEEITLRKQIGNMDIPYDITEDCLYQQGIEKGKQDVIAELLKEGTLPIEKIASMAKVSMDYVQQVARERKH